VKVIRTFIDNFGMLGSLLSLKRRAIGLVDCIRTLSRLYVVYASMYVCIYLLEIQCEYHRSIPTGISPTSMK
jgi:hypothetical protein